MADFEGDLGRLEAQFAGLEGTVAGLEGVTGAFRRELEGVQGSMKDAGPRGVGHVALGDLVAAAGVRGRALRRQAAGGGAGRDRARASRARC